MIADARSSFVYWPWVGDHLGFDAEHIAQQLRRHNHCRRAARNDHAMLDGDNVMGMARCVIQVVNHHDDRPSLFLVEPLE